MDAEGGSMTEKITLFALKQEFSDGKFKYLRFFYTRDDASNFLQNVVDIVAEKFPKRIVSHDDNMLILHDVIMPDETYTMRVVEVDLIEILNTLSNSNRFSLMDIL